MINFIRTSKTGYILGLLLFVSAGISAGCSAKAESRTPSKQPTEQATPQPTQQAPPSSVSQEEVAKKSQSLDDYRRNRNPYSDMPYDGDMEYSTPQPRRSSQSINAAGFQKIKVGMALTEVEKMLDEPGMLVSSMEVNGRQTQIYKWSNSDYSRYIDVTIENGKVIEKKAKGLK